MSNKNVTIKDGIINIPYNFNNEKYIVGIENKETNEIEVSKTIIPIKEAKPSYSLVITPKQYDISGSKVSPFFHVEKNKDGKYSFINSEVIYTVNFIVDDIQIPVSDYTIKTDWDKYNITKSIEPFEIKVSVNDSTTAIESGSTQYTILENSGSFDEEVNIFIDYNDIMFTTTLKTTFQKSYFETISLYDSIDIASRTDKTDIKRNVITIDGFYNDNKVDKENLTVNFDLDSNDNFTTLASTMGYIDIVKEKNEWYLEHEEMGKGDYTRKTPLHGYIVDNNHNILEDGKIIVSGDSLYKNGNKIIDSYGAIYNGNTVLIDNSGNTKLTNNIIIDNSGNTIYNNKKIIDNDKKNVNTINEKFIVNLNENKIYSTNSGCTVDITNNRVYSGTTTNVILNEKGFIPLQFDSGKYRYDFSNKILYSGGTQNTGLTIYNNSTKQLNISGNTNYNIIPSTNKYLVSGNTIIENGDVKRISSFGYNIKYGVISTNKGESLVTAITSNNKQTVDATELGYTFSNNYTKNYGYYINDISGNIKYNSSRLLLSGQTVYSDSGGTPEGIIIVKNTDDGGIRYNGITCPIKFGYNSTSGFTSATGYTDYTGTTKTFEININNTLHIITLELHNGAKLTSHSVDSIPYVETNCGVSFTLSTASTIYGISAITVNGIQVESKDSGATLNLNNITSDTVIKVLTYKKAEITLCGVTSYMKQVQAAFNSYASKKYTNTGTYHKKFKKDDDDNDDVNNIIMYCGTTQICTFNKSSNKITYCNFAAPGGSITTGNTISFILNGKIKFIQTGTGSTSFNIYANDNKIISLKNTLLPNKIKLCDKYYYYADYKYIYYNSDIDDNNTDIQANLNYFIIGDKNNKNSGTYISYGVITYNGNKILDLSNGTTKFSNNLAYYYKNKNLNYNTNNTIINFIDNVLYYINGLKVLDLNNDNIIDNNGKILVNNKKEISGNTGFIYYIDNKRVIYNVLTYDLNTSGSVIITGNTTSGYVITYNKDTGTTLNNGSNNIIISGNKINLDLEKGYTLTATTGYVKDVDDVNKTILTAITTNVDNRHTYTWDVESKCIKEGEDILTNINKDRPFYYCNTSGNICYNKNIVEYIIDENDEYWNISNGNKVLIKDKDKRGESLIFKPRNGKVVPPKKEIEDKYGNIKINKKTSFDKKTGTYRDEDNKIITGVTSGASQYPLDESYYTTIVDLRNGYISDANGRALMNSNGKSVYIEGGLELTRRDDGTDAAILSKNGVVLVSGITGNSIGELTNEANEYGVTKKNDIYFYKGKKLYDSNGAYYFEKLITETTNTGFTLQNGITIKPKHPEAKTRSTIGGSGDRPDYTYGVEIVAGDFVVTITQKDDGQGGGGGGYYPSESGGTENPGFTITDDGLLYLGAKIVDFKDGKIYDISSLLDINNRIDFTKIPDTTIVHVDADDITIIDETGKNDIYEIEEKETVYYDSHLVENIKTYIPDLISYFFKSNKKESYKLNVETSYMGVMKDKKDYLIVDGGKNHSSYKIKVEPQFITQNMIKNGTTVKAYVVNNNGDQIPYDTYSGNGYTFKYTTDTNSDFEKITGNTFIYTLSTETPIFNEIKFNLECEGNLINQEIIEVLGENKFITSTEYINNTDSGVRFKITETVNTYYNTDIIWDIEKSLDGVTYDTRINTLKIPSGVTGTVILSGTCNNIKVYEKAIVITKNGEKGEQGETGETGPRGPEGPRGKLLYPAGRWNSGTTYDGTDNEKTPFVTYKVGDEDKYYVLTAVTEISGMDYKPTDSGWTEMAQYEALYTKLLVAENGLVGGSVYNGDYVFSKNGINVNNGISFEGEYYSNFDDAIVDSIFSGGTSLNSFIPNYLVDFNQGRAWFGNGKSIIDKNGVFYTKDIVEMIKDFPIPYPSGSTGWDLIQSYTTPTGGTLSLNDKVYIKNIDSLNSYLFDDDFGNCPITPIILHYYIPDYLITRPNTFYKGEIYLGNSCASQKYISFPGQTIKYNNTKYEEVDKKTLGIHVMGTTTTNEIGGNKIEFLVKWDGKSTVSIKKANQRFPSTIKKLDIELIGKYEVEKILRFI